MNFMRNGFNGLSLITLLSASIYAGDISLKGRILEPDGLPAVGIAVQLKNLPYGDTTDQNGNYKITVSDVPNVGIADKSIFEAQDKSIGSFKYQDQKTILNILNASHVKIEIYKSNGVLVHKPLDKFLQKGSYTVLMTSPSMKEGAAKNGAYLVHVSMGQHQHSFVFVLNGLSSSSSVTTSKVSSAENTISKKISADTAGSPDSLVVFDRDNRTLYLELPRYRDSLPDMLLRAFKGSPFLLHENFGFNGAATLKDFSTGKDIVIPFEKRIHIMLLAEGYTQAVHDSGKFDADVNRWIADAFTHPPLSQWKGAFVIWKMPAVSKDLMLRGKAADTYFEIGRSGDWIGSLDQFEPLLWKEVKKFKYYATSEFWPAGGRMTTLAKNIIVPVLTYDPEIGRAGLRGSMTNHADPANSSHRICTSIATGQFHEFMHCFAGLKDEYYNSSAGPQDTEGYGSMQTSKYWTNTTLQHNCDSLPWKHLLPGGSINKSTDSLIGAFGSSDFQFHSELKCLMNGTFDNKLLYGADSLRRATLCNVCREITVFRLFERIGIFKDHSTSAAIWRSDYRQEFFDTYGFDVPEVVPQKTQLGKAIYMQCKP